MNRTIPTLHAGRLLLLAVAALQFTACELVEGIFKAGLWVGILAVVATLALVAFGVSKLRS